jgi:hypothetical protein
MSVYGCIVCMNVREFVRMCVLNVHFAYVPQLCNAKYTAAARGLLNVRVSERLSCTSQAGLARVVNIHSTVCTCTHQPPCKNLRKKPPPLG